MCYNQVIMKILVVDDMRQWRNYHKNALNFILNDVEYDLYLAESATNAYKNILENIETPYDLIITDLQMEDDYEPLYAGEWLIAQTQTLKQYTAVPKIIVSAAPNIKMIAENYNVEFLRKPSLIHTPLTYELKIKELLNI